MIKTQSYDIIQSCTPILPADYEEEQEQLRLEIDVIEEWVEQREEMDEGLNAFIALTQKYVDV